MRWSEEMSIEELDPRETFRKRFTAFGTQAKRWEPAILRHCIEDVDRRIADGRETQNVSYVREQLVKRFLLNEALREKETE